MEQADDELLIDGLTMAELSERLDLLGPNFAGTFDSFEALVRFTDGLAPRSFLAFGVDAKKPTG